MNKLQKSQLFDELSKLLTEYEEAKQGEDPHKNFEADLYDMLVRIQNLWEEIT